MAAHGRADIRADCNGVSEALGGRRVVTLSHPKQSPTEHCEAELKLTAGVVVFSVGVNEGSPQASRPTGPAEHACIVFHIHIVSICGQRASTGTLPLVRFERATRLPRSPRVLLLLSCPTLPSLGVSEALGGRRVVTLSHPKQSPTEHCEAEHKFLKSLSHDVCG